MMTGAQWEHGKTFPIYLPDIKASPYRHASEPKRTPKAPALPWAMIAPHAKQARINHSMSLDTLAQRGGLDWSEALAVLQDRLWKRMSAHTAETVVRALVVQFVGVAGRVAA